MLGGTHGLNGMIYLRGNKRDFDTWESLGNPTWNWENVLKYFKKSESNEKVDFLEYQNGKYHSADGQLKVGKYFEHGQFRDIFVEAVKEKGLNFVDELNADIPLGYSNLQGTTSAGLRQTTAKAFLVSAKNRPNLHVMKHALVSKLNIDDNGEVKGVTFKYNSTKEFVARAKKEVVLSAGAISSPHLLMLSGIGPKKHLEAYKIPVRKNLPVGKNLQDHLVVPVIFQFHKSTAKSVKVEDAFDDLYQYAIHKTGILAGVGAINLAGLIDTTDSTGYPDIELQHFDFRKNSLEMTRFLEGIGYEDNINRAIKDANADGDIVVVFVELLNPKSRGKILLRSSLVTDPVRIIPDYLEDKRDVETLLRGIKYQADFTKTKSFEKHEGKLIKIPIAECDKIEYMSDDYWRCYTKYMTTTVFHPVGTAKMGPSDDKKSVVDHELRVKGIKKLRVIDASIMPNMVSGNTNAATIMIGEKGVDFIKTAWDQAKDEL